MSVYMPQHDDNLKFSYELPLDTDDRDDDGQFADGRPGDSLPDDMLLLNVRWFCQLRWCVVAVLVGFGLLGMVTPLCRLLNLRQEPQWPFAAAALLVLENLVFVGQLRARGRGNFTHTGRVSLWSQIVIDLIVLTVVVHYVGARSSFLPAGYLFHIVLACVFFSRRESLGVTLLACGLFSLCILLEDTGVISTTSVYATAPSPYAPGQGSLAGHINVIGTEAFWLVVWFLTSQLSVLVRDRDRELARANRRLVAAQEDRARHMLLTTHELKAPFAAIHANAQLLVKGYCGLLPDAALEVVLRIAARARRLGSEIQDMLQLANLRSISQDPPKPVKLDVIPVLKWSVDQVRSLADERNIVVSLEKPEGHLYALGVEDHFKMLFTNLLTNAVSYSQRGGRVDVVCRDGGENRAVVTVRDYGIGIPEEKLPRIFEEYYRTDEAVRHCRESTGLGLTIVRRVARAGRISVQVSSEPGLGTRWQLLFPAPGTAFNGQVAAS